MNVLIIGNGGREHALAWKIKQSPQCSELYVAPGNAGTAQVAENVPIAVTDFEGLGNLCLERKIELVVVGPEAPLVEGIRDYFEHTPALSSILMIGPGQAGARLEGSKDFSKQFMLKHGVPTARATTFTRDSWEDAVAFLKSVSPPFVLKADGLAAGKGVIICATLQEAEEALREMLLEEKFGTASTKVLIEEFLDGIELSVFVLTDGSHYVILPEAKDYKRIGDGDTGPNTGGMGAVSPVVFADAAFMKKVEDQVVKPTIEGLRRDGIPYVGFIFIGLMNVQGYPKVIEYNVRMGDPETQAVMPRIQNDLLPVLAAAARGELHGGMIDMNPQVAVTVTLASGGYPNSYEKGKQIAGLDRPYPALIFHAGTRQMNQHVVTDGGRVMAVTGMGPDLPHAIDTAYQTISGLSWDGLYFRKDIGQDLQNWSN